MPIWTSSLAAGIKLTLKSTSPPLCSYGKKHIWWKIIQNTWMKFMVFILTVKPAFLILQECVCLLYAAVPSGELLENWVVSPSQITSLFVTVSQLWLGVSDLRSALRMSLCSPSETAPNRACRVPGFWITSKFDLSVLAWYYLGSRDMSRMEKVLVENNNSTVLLSVKF